MSSKLIALAARLAICLITGAFPSASQAVNPQDIRLYLEDFQREPSRVMQDRLAHSGDSPPTTLRSFEDRLRMRQEICARTKTDCSNSDRAGVTEEDRVDRLVEGIGVVKRLSEMESRGLTAAALPHQPWSDSYWPIKNGAAAWRYQDPRFPSKILPKASFADNHSYFLANPPQSTAARWLSPAEKYDRLIGDPGFALTLANWQKGLDALSENGNVPGWIGLCHGWAPASFSAQEALHPVRVRVADGSEIVFEPSDIHALVTALWADSLLDDQYVLIGNICSVENPQKDEVGRPIDPKCFTTNPGTWHMAIVNKIGVAEEGFIMDATFDFEIWNQPVHSYKYTYFNPQTLEVADDLFGSMIPIESFKSDKFKTYRSPKTRFVVGIAMDVSYGDEVSPRPGPRTNRNRLRTVRYIYDLELDSRFEIIGGEWYTTRHPDFIWAPGRGLKPRSHGELALGLQSTWRVGEEIQADLLRAAALSSPKAQPLTAIVDGLIEAAQVAAP